MAETAAAGSSPCGPEELSPGAVQPWAWAALAAMAILFLGLAISSLVDKSVTVDEFGHLPAGYNLLRTGDFRYCELNPPLMNLLSALPLLAFPPPAAAAPRPGDFGDGFEPGHGFWNNGYAFMFDHRADYHARFVAARCVTVLLVAGLGLLVFLWARETAPRAADAAGLLAAGLTWFSPNLLAHARLVTTDAGVACFMALALFAFHRLLTRPGARRAVACGLALGAAQLVKFSAIYLYPVIAVVAAARLWRRRPDGRALLAATAGALLLSVAVVNAGYLFDGSGTPLSGYRFESRAAAALQQALPGWLPVPLPRQYVAAFDRQLQGTQRGDRSYLLGERYHGGRWYYFPTLILFKTPLPALALFLLAAFAAVRGRGPRAWEALLLLPGATLLLMFSLASNKQLGLRMLLPATPLLAVWIACRVGGGGRPAWWRASVLALAAWFGLESLLVHPNYLTYFNQLAGGPSGGYRIALDSNVDWGQDLPALRRYMDEHGIESMPLFYFGRVDPGIYGVRYTVPRARLEPGPFAISVSYYGLGYGVYDHGRIRQQVPLDFEGSMLGSPVARIRNSIHVYDVPPP